MFYWGVRPTMQFSEEAGSLMEANPGGNQRSISEISVLLFGFFAVVRLEFLCGHTLFSLLLLVPFSRLSGFAFVPSALDPFEYSFRTQFS